MEGHTEITTYRLNWPSGPIQWKIYICNEVLNIDLQTDALQCNVMVELK